MRSGSATAPPSPRKGGLTQAGPMLRHGWRRLASSSASGLLRQFLFVAILLLVWVTLKPFSDLSGFGAGDIVSGQEGLTYGLFGLLAVVAVALVLPDHPRALGSLATPAYLLLFGWLAASVVYSIDPGTSAKRLSLSFAVLVVTACLPLLPRSLAELRNLLGIACLALLALCYVGMLVVPELTIHQVTDVQEPFLAGAWRGVFGHKNGAAAVVAMVLFVGIAVIRTGAPFLGGAVLVLAATFLVGSEGKSAFGLCLAAFAMTGLFAIVRSFFGRAVLVFGAIALINALTVGTVMNEALAALVAKLPVDTTFTGRAGLWRFALDSIQDKLMLGHGFSAFWKTEATQVLAEGSGDYETNWAGNASHSHNGYLDTVLGLGLVGLAFTLFALLYKPLRDYQSASRSESAAGPFATMFVQIWLFGMLLSAMESFFFDRADAVWVTVLFAVFGLHYLARFKSA